MLRCKVGDLAILIRSEFEENVGQIVEVVGSGEEYGVWEVKGVRPGRARDWETGEVFYDCGDLAWVEDERLLPVGGMGLKEKVVEEVS